LALGTCPDAPRQEGSYQIAGLAHFAHTHSIRNDRDGDQTVTTYGVALAPSIPKIVIDVPGNTGKKITLLPACQNLREGNSCSLVDYKIINLPSTTAGVTSGKVYVNWETGEQGGDYDMDVQGILRYEVNAATVKVTTDVFAGATGAAMGFGYIINGTTQDGFHAHSGHSGGTPSSGYLYTDPSGANGCASKCSSGDAATTNTYTIGTSSAQTLQLPLWYAAKWGGFNDSNGNNIPDLTSEWDADNNGLPDRYYYATNPKELATSLSNALANIIKDNSSSSLFHFYILQWVSCYPSF
jgi:type IV pilus assembly protein PilY1